jgi:hypothetical protein
MAVWFAFAGDFPHVYRPSMTVVDAVGRVNRQGQVWL